MSQSMSKKTLGSSDIELTPIGMGAWQFSEGKFFNGFIWEELSKENTETIIATAIDEGINWFDTAEAYGLGRSEQGLSAGLQKKGVQDEDIRIATKWFPLLRFASNIPKTIDTRMEKLSPYSIDLYQIHHPWSFSFPKTQMKKMAEIADLGKIRTIGVSNFSASKMRHAFEELEKFGYPLVSNQVKYNLMERDIETNGLLDTAQELGITIIAYSPLEMGLLTGKFHENPDLIKSRPFFRRRMLKSKLEESQELINLFNQIADERGVTCSQVALNWLISYHDGIMAIPGASKPSHVKDNAGTMRFELSREQLNAIDEVAYAFM